MTVAPVLYIASLGPEDSMAGGGESCHDTTDTIV